MSESGPDLKLFELFVEFNDEDREVVAELLECKKVAKGRRVFREGTEAEGLVLLTKGTLELSSARTPHKSVAGPGSAIGALSLMVVGARELVALTLEPCELWVLPRESYRRLVDDYPRTACRLCEAIVADLAGNVRDALDDFSDR